MGERHDARQEVVLYTMLSALLLGGLAALAAALPPTLTAYCELPLGDDLPALVAAVKEMHGRIAIVSGERIRDEFDKLITLEHPATGLWFLVDTGLADEFLPELSGLRLEQDPIHRHKDVLTHTIAVVENVRRDAHPSFDFRRTRLAAFYHDIGKPRTRSYRKGKGVSFHHHEVVGARMTRDRMQTLRYSNEDVEQVTKLVELHLRFHTYKMGWTDAAVRRYVRDAGSFQFFRSGEQLGPGLRRGDALFGEDVLTIVDAPLVIGVGHAPLLAVDGHRGGSGLQLVVQAIGFPDIRDVFEQTGLDEGLHAVAGIPCGDIGCVSGQEVADGRLVAFVVEVVPLDRDIGVGLLEIGDQLFHRLFRRRVGVVGIENDFTGKRGGRQKGSTQSKAAQAFEKGHVFLPMTVMLGICGA